MKDIDDFLKSRGIKIFDENSDDANRMLSETFNAENTIMILRKKVKELESNIQKLNIIVDSLKLEIKAREAEREKIQKISLRAKKWLEYGVRDNLVAEDIIEEFKKAMEE